jgi:hypothetical protein
MARLSLIYSVRRATVAASLQRITGFVFNSWNNSVDNNGGKSVGLSVTGRPTGALTIVENYMDGPETTGDNTGWRHLSDTIVTYTVDKMPSGAFNYDFGKDQEQQSDVEGRGHHMSLTRPTRPTGPTRPDLSYDHCDSASATKR